MQLNRIFCFLLMGWILFGVSNILQAQGAANSGIISAVDIHDKTIQIGEKIYGIVDGVLITSKNNTLLNQLALSAGQQITYELAPQPLDISKNSPLPSQVMTKIQILSGFTENAIQH